MERILYTYSTQETYFCELQIPLAPNSSTKSVPTEYTIDSETVRERNTGSKTSSSKGKSIDWTGLDLSNVDLQNAD